MNAGGDGDDGVRQPLDELRRIIRSLGSCLVAFSGGVDSALVLAVAHEQLGGELALACIGISPSFPARERTAAIELARQIGARCRLIEPAEHLGADSAANAHDRCYFCRAALFDQLSALAAEEGWNAVADGTHLDDLVDHTHGIRAAAERRVRSPLREAQFRKQDVRNAARALGLSAWDKPAMACLASRIPHGTPITATLLRQIESAEDVLAASGLRQFRVRHHGEIARIEVAADELPRLIEHRDEIARQIRAAGYTHVTLDLAGFRSGGAPIELHVRRG